MKTKLLILASLCLGTFGLTSCSNDSVENVTPTAKEVTIKFGATVGEDSRTAYDPALAGKVTWKDGDKVRLYDGTGKNILTVAAADITTTGSTVFTYATTVGNHTFTALYPLSADKELSGSKFKIELPKTQTYVTPTTANGGMGSFDGAADILVAKSVTTNVTETTAQEIPLVFKRPLAVCNFMLKTNDPSVSSLVGKKIQSVKISVEATNPKYLTGNFYALLSSGKIVNSSDAEISIPSSNIFYYGKQSDVTLVPDDSDNAVFTAADAGIPVWAVVAPVKLESGDKLIFEVTTTDNNTVKKEITLSSDVVFKAGSRTKLNINLKGAAAVVKTNISAVADGNTYSLIEGTVTAECTRGFVLTDATGSILYYDEDYTAGTYPVGTKLILKDGEVSSYNTGLEIENATITTNGTEAVTYPTPINYTATEIDAYVGNADNGLAKYVTYSGTLTISGTYYNVAVSGATGKGSIYFPLTSVSSTLIDNSTVTVTGYAVAVSTSTYLNTVVTSVVTTSDAVSADPESLSWAATATDAKTVTVTSSGAWTATIDNTAFALSATSGVNGGTFTVNPTGTNTTASAKTAIVTLTCGTATATVSCSQAAAGAAQFTLVPDDFSGASYAANNGSHTKDGISYYSSNTMKSSGYIQMKKNAGYLYNTTDLNKITSIVIELTSGPISVYEGSSQNPTGTAITPTQSGTTYTYTLSGNNGYFLIEAGSSAAKMSSIEVNYE